jgi:hypothetical protein
MEHLSMDMEHSTTTRGGRRITARVNTMEERKVLELSSQGHSQRGISKILQIGIDTDIGKRDMFIIYSETLNWVLYVIQSIEEKGLHWKITI